ncbi:unnamed protein product [Malus baccata var. baccata]
MVNFTHKAGGCLKFPGVDSSSTVVQRGQGWLGFAPGMMGYKVQVVALAIALPIRQKIEKGGRSTIDFQGNESIKMVVVASKNSIGVGRNQPWKMGGRNGEEDEDGRDGFGVCEEKRGG